MSGFMISSPLNSDSTCSLLPACFPASCSVKSLSIPSESGRENPRWLRIIFFYFFSIYFYFFHYFFIIFFSPSRQRAGERTQAGWESWIGMLDWGRERGTTNKSNYYFQILKAVNQEESKMTIAPLINWKDLVKKFMGEALPAVRPPEADDKNSWSPDQCCTIGHDFLTNTADTMSSPYVVSGIPDTWRMWSKWQWYYDICVSSTFVPLSLTTVKPTGQSWSQQSHTWKLNHRKWWKFKTGYNTSMCALQEFVCH